MKSSLLYLFLWIATSSLMFTISSCSFIEFRQPAKARTVLYEWNDDRGPGEVSIEIDLAKQIASYKRGNRPIGWSYVSTGKEGHSTATGTYTITEKLPVKFSDRYGWLADETGRVTNGDAKPTTPVPPGEHYSPAPMHFWMRITSYGVGLHQGEIPRPGEAASHGCIRLPADLVPKLYEATQVGTPVKIVWGEPVSG